MNELVAKWKEPIQLPVSAVIDYDVKLDDVPRKAWKEHTVELTAFGIADKHLPTKIDYYALLHKIDGDVVQCQKFVSYLDAKEAALYRYPKPWPWQPF